MTIGFALTGSYCTFERIFPVLELLAREHRVIPIVSANVHCTDSRFGTAGEHIAALEQICESPVIHTISQAEPIGPRHLLEALIIAPCTGNTLGKLSHGIADTPVTMAAKSHLRNGGPVILAVSTNDGLSGSAENIGRLLNRKNYYFVPFRQDDPVNKPTSLVADFSRIGETLDRAMEGRQLQPVLIA